MITAQQAFDAAKYSVTKHLEAINDLVKKESDKGNYCATYVIEDLDTSFEVMQKLKSLGFKVDSMNEFGFDLKWLYNISISWKSPKKTAKKKQSSGKK